MVGLGYIEAGTTLTVDVPISSGNSGYIDIYLCKLDDEKFVQGYNLLKAEQLNIETFEETNIVGNVTASRDCLFYTSIPYDESWQIYVDGERVSIEEMQECKIGNGFIGFYLTEGEHQIEFKYVPRGLVIGLCVSGVTVAALIVLFVILRKTKLVTAMLNGYSSEAEIIDINLDDLAEENKTDTKNKK